jgi:hypothetical protein
VIWLIDLKKATTWALKNWSNAPFLRQPSDCESIFIFELALIDSHSWVCFDAEGWEGIMTDDELTQLIGGLQANTVVHVAMVTGLIKLLRDKGVFTLEEQRAAFDEELLKLETGQGKFAPQEQWIMEMARNALEKLVKPPAPKYPPVSD